MNMKKVVAVAVASMAFGIPNLFGTSAVAETQTNKYVPAGNVISNYGFETDAAGYNANTCAIEVSTEYAYEGTKSLKISGRTAAWNTFEYNLAGLSFNEWYEYSFYAYSTTGEDVIASWSPWGVNAAGQYIWTYGNGSWTRVHANTWTKLNSVFRLTMSNGQLIVQTWNPDGTISNFATSSNNGTGDDCARFDLMRLALQASLSSDLYVDMVTVAPYEHNMIANSGVEQNTNGYAGNGCSIAASKDVAYEGANSLKLSGRTEVWNAYTYDVAGFAFDQWYEYSFYVYSENYVDVLATWSPWGVNQAGSYVYIYGSGTWTGVPAKTWTKVSSTFKLTKSGDQLVVVTPNGQNGYNYFPATSDNGTGNDCARFDIMRVSLNATATANFYVDMLTVKQVAAPDFETFANQTFAMIDGAQVRMANPTGLRFSALYAKEYVDFWTAKGYEVEMGMLIAPTQFITAEKGALTLENTNYVLDTDYKQIVCEECSVFDGNYRINGVLKVAENHYDVAFTGIAYVKITKNGVSMYKYATGTENSRSIKAVATAALEANQTNATLSEEQVAVLEKIVG